MYRIAALQPYVFSIAANFTSTRRCIRFGPFIYSQRMRMQKRILWLNCARTVLVNVVTWLWWQFQSECDLPESAVWHLIPHILFFRIASFSAVRWCEWACVSAANPKLKRKNGCGEAGEDEGGGPSKRASVAWPGHQGSQGSARGAPEGICGRRSRRRRWVCVYASFVRPFCICVYGLPRPNYVCVRVWLSVN